MPAITRNLKNDCYHSESLHRDLQQKLNTTKFVSVINFNMLLAILDSSHYQKSQKWLPPLTESIDLQEKANTTGFGSIFNFNFNFNVLSVILDGSHYQTQ